VEFGFKRNSLRCKSDSAYSYTFSSVAWSVCLPVVCHVRASCLNRSTYACRCRLAGTPMRSSDTVAEEKRRIKRQKGEKESIEKNQTGERQYLALV